MRWAPRSADGGKVEEKAKVVLLGPGGDPTRAMAVAGPDAVVVPLQSGACAAAWASTHASTNFGESLTASAAAS